MICKRRSNYLAWRTAHPDAYERHKYRMRLQQQARRLLAKADGLKSPKKPPKGK